MRRARGIRFEPLIVGVALVVACESPQERAAGQLKRQGLEASVGGLIGSIPRGDPKVIATYVAAGVDVNSKDASGTTPLCAAVTSGADSMVAEFLALKQVKVDEPCAPYGTALAAAHEGSRDSLVKLLLAAGARPPLEVVLPVRAGMPWAEGARALREAGTECSDSAVYDSVSIQCQVKPIVIGGARMDSLRIHGNGSGTVNQIVLVGQLSGTGCKGFLDEMTPQLGGAWMATDRKSTTFDAEVKGDRRARAACTDKGASALLMLEDKWIFLPTGRKNFFGGELWVWNLVSDVTSRMVSAGKTLGAPRSQQDELVRMILPELEKAFSRARGAATDLNTRNKKMLEDYSSLVQSNGWYRRLYMEKWDLKEE